MKSKLLAIIVILTIVLNVRGVLPTRAAPVCGGGREAPMSNTDDVVGVIYNQAHASVQWQDGAAAAMSEEIGR